MTYFEALDIIMDAFDENPDYFEEEKAVITVSKIAPPKVVEAANFCKQHEINTRNSGNVMY